MPKGCSKCGTQNDDAAVFCRACGNSLVVAAAFMIGQTDLKRLLAYSSVEHMGLLVLGLGLGGSGTYGTVLHVLNNGLTKGLMFLTVGNIVLVTGTSHAPSMRGVLRRAPTSGVLLLAGLFAVTGSPPFGPFMSELTILRGAVEHRLERMQQDNAAKLEQMRQTVDEKLHATLEKRLSESFRQVSERLELVHRGLGEMQTLAAGVGDLKRVLSNVKTRGVFGETQLAALLEQVMAPEQYEKNVATRPGSGSRPPSTARACSRCPSSPTCAASES